MKTVSRMAGVVAAIAVVAPVGYYFWSAAQNLPPADKISVTFTDYAGDAPSIIAYTQGFFREQGLEVDFKHHSTGVKSLESLREGQADIATTSEFPLVRAALDEASSPPPAGARFLVIGDTVYSYGSHEVVVRSDRKIRTAADLKGRRVGMPAGNTAADYFLGNLLRQNGIAEVDVQLTSLAVGSLAPALDKGEIDAFVAWEPFISEAKTRLGVRVLSFPANPLYSTSWLIVVSERFAKSNSDLLPKFLRAIKKAERFIQERPQHAMDVVAGHTGVDRQIVARAWESLEFRLSLSQALLATVEEEARWLISSKRTGATEVPNFLDYIHAESLKKVSPATVTLIK